MQLQDDDDESEVEADHYIPEKSEHELPSWAAQDDLELQEEEEHVATRKSEHHLDGRRPSPSDDWRPKFHSKTSEEFADEYDMGEEDGIPDEYLNDSPEEELPALSRKLAPKKPNLDDPRLRIPQGKASEEHDHLLVDKDPVPTAEHKEQYGLSYEDETKKAKKGER